MKPQFLKLSKGVANSFNARRDTTPDVNNRWHYHPEVELIYFKKGSGTQFIGDDIRPFLTGDVVLVGADLPHYWKFDSEYFYQKDRDTVEVAVIHFNETFWGREFLDLPENKKIRSVLDKAKRGIRVSMSCKDTVAPLTEQIIDANGPQKIILLMQVLLAIEADTSGDLLASVGFECNFQENEKDRLHDIYNYSIANFNKKITLQEIATIANLSPNSFCKFFRSRSGKTYSQFINEIRIGNACKLLIDNKLHVKEICYKSGFYNFASFHKYFKKLTGKSPLNYQKKFTESNLAQPYNIQRQKA